MTEECTLKEYSIRIRYFTEITNGIKIQIKPHGDNDFNTNSYIIRLFWKVMDDIYFEIW